jgi:hypothetical protein
MMAGGYMGNHRVVNFIDTVVGRVKTARYDATSDE